MPILIQESVYEIKMQTMIIILNDVSEEKSLNDYVNKKMEIFKKNNLNSYISYLDINLNSAPLIDIWSKYIHKLDLYTPKVNNIDVVRGGLISNEERENFKLMIFKFFNEFIKPHLQTLVTQYDENVNYSKKGFKNSFLSIFKKSDRVENIQALNIYKVNLA